MSYGLGVLAMADDATVEEARQMYERCTSPASHAESELDERVVGLYEELPAEFPGYPPYGLRSRWMSMPLSTESIT